MQWNDDPLKLKAQDVLGHFEQAKSLVNTPSALGVNLMPLTPALMSKDSLLLPGTTNHVDSSDRLSAFTSLSSLQPHASEKTSKGTFFLRLRSSGTNDWKSDGCPSYN